MSCFRPVLAYQDESGRVRFGGRAADVISRAQSTPRGRPMELPCGRCLGCRMERRRSWSVRCMHEASLYDANLFVTWTYADENMPSSKSLEYEDFQLMMKRLRKKMKGVSPGPKGNYPIRFFCSGEYGSTYQRPHWHAILFNTYFPDMVPMHNGKFLSETADKLWEYRGRIEIGTVTPRSAAYVAGYTLEKVYGNADFYEDVVNLATGEVTGRRPEFCTMSRRPGIGTWWYEKYQADLFGNSGDHDFAVVDGKKYKVPRFYWNKVLEDPSRAELAERIKEARFLRAMEVDNVENSDLRRAAREKAAAIQIEVLTGRSIPITTKEDLYARVFNSGPQDA